MDTKLSLKPIEIIDIGIDKHTKMPMPILSENILFTNDVINSVPINTFTLTTYSTTFNIVIASSRNISLNFDFGDEFSITMTGSTIITEHTYSTNSSKIIKVSGDLDKIISLTSIGTSLTEVNIIKLKKLSTLNLSGNSITEINLTGLVNLKNININNNYLTSSATDDIFIQADTFLTYEGTIDVAGTNNPPSIYSSLSRDDLQYNKNWTLIYS